MVRTQIQLTERQYREVKRIAREDGVSLAEIIRRFVDGALGGRLAGGRGELYERAAQLVGAFRAARRDLSTKHDSHLEEAFG
jgi:hypothetical protein